MAGIFVGEVEVGVVPNLEGFSNKNAARASTGGRFDRARHGTALTRGMLATLDVGALSAMRPRAGLAVLPLRPTRLAGTSGQRATKRHLLARSVSGRPLLTRPGVESQRRPAPATVRVRCSRTRPARIDAEFAGKDVHVEVKFDTDSAMAKLRADLAASINGAIADTVVGGVGRGDGSGGVSLGGGGGSNLGALAAGRALAGGGRSSSTRGTAIDSRGRVVGTSVSDIPSAIRGLFSGGGSGGGGGGGSSLPTGGGGGIFGNIPACWRAQPLITAGIVAGLVSLPTLATVAASGIVAAFGAATAGIAIIGAMQNAEVSQTYTELKNRVMEDFQIIGQSWVTVLESIFNTAKQTMDLLTPVFTRAAGIIAGPFKLFADTLIRHSGRQLFAPLLSLWRTLPAAILTAVTPQLASDVGEIANDITDIANTLATHPKSFADFIGFLTGVASFGLQVVNVLAKMPPDLLISIGLAIGTIVVATKLWAIAQGILDIALADNPVGLVIIAIGLLVAAIYELVKHWTTVKTFVEHVWDNVKPIWNAVWTGLRKIFASFIVDGILGPLGEILKGAAAAFGWIPGIGPKLKTASAQFQQFMVDVNRSLSGINDQTVNVSVAMTAKTNPYPGGISGRAAGGLYIGSGRFGVDDQLIPAQRGELIVPPRTVSAGYVDHLRGSIPGFAAGGIAGGVNVVPSFPATSAMNKMLMWNVQYLAGQSAQAVALRSAHASSGSGRYRQVRSGASR